MNLNIQYMFVQCCENTKQLSGQFIGFGYIHTSLILHNNPLFCLNEAEVLFDVKDR